MELSETMSEVEKWAVRTFSPLFTPQKLRSIQKIEQWEIENRKSKVLIYRAPIKIMEFARVILIISLDRFK